MEAWLADFVNGFTKAFITGDRWKLYLKGLGTTLEITVIALVIGVVLGVLVAVIRTAHDQQRPGRCSPVLGILNFICKDVYKRQVHRHTSQGTKIAWIF